MLNKHGRGRSKAMRRAYSRQQARRDVEKILRALNQEWHEAQEEMRRIQLSESLDRGDGLDIYFLSLLSRHDSYEHVMLGT